MCSELLLYVEELRKSEDGNQNWIEAELFFKSLKFGLATFFYFKNAFKRSLLMEFSEEC